MAKKLSRNTKLKIWSCYHITFLDHCCNDDKLTQCEVVGWLTKENPDSYVFSHWIVSNDDNARVHNLEHTTLAKKLIVSIRKLF